MLPILREYRLPKDIGGEPIAEMISELLKMKWLAILLVTNAAEDNHRDQKIECIPRPFPQL